MMDLSTMLLCKIGVPQVIYSSNMLSKLWVQIWHCGLDFVAVKASIATIVTSEGGFKMACTFSCG
jgi:hypothetical protein